MIDSDNHSGLSDGNIVAYDDTDHGADDDDGDVTTPRHPGLKQLTTINTYVETGHILG